MRVGLCGIIIPMRKNLNLVARSRFALFGSIDATFFITSAIVLAVGVPTVFAAPFAPGETLDPGCTPGSADCTVLQIAVDTTTNKYGIGTTTPWAKLSVAGVASLGTSPLFTVSSSSPSATTTVFHIDYTGNIGIGATTTPGTLLSVQGVANFGTATSTFNSTGGINLLSGCFAVNGTCVSGGGGSGTINAATSIGQVPYYAAASNAVTATSTLFISTASNVGIGTTTPEAKLEVAGNIFFSALSSGTRRLQVGTSTNDGADITGAGLEILAGGASVTTGNGYGGAILIRAGIGGSDPGSTGGALTVSGGSSYGGGSALFSAGNGDGGDGGVATVRAGDATQTGGLLTVRGGDSTGSAGGQLVLRGGNESSSNAASLTLVGGSGGSGGSLTLSGGSGEGGGAVTISAGASGTTGGSTVTINASNGSGGDGGAVSIYAGNGSAGYVGGNINLYGGTGDTSGNVILADVGGTPRGRVGIGTSTPYAELSVHAPAGTPSFLVGSTTGTYFIINENGNVGIGTTTPTLGPLTMDSGAYVTAGGTWTNASSRALKENFTALDSAEVLAQINSLGITRWNYKTESVETTHIGPIAEEFYDAFRVGGSSGQSSISSIDPAGVALIGIQALSKKVEALENRGYSGGISLSSILDSFKDLGTDIVSGLAVFKDVIAETLTVRKLCLEDVCITKTELRDLLEKNGIFQSASVTSSTTNVSTTTPDSTASSSPSSNEASEANSAIPTDTEPPVITVVGNNPATVEKGSSYADLGATVADNVNDNLGVTVSGDTVDTETVGEYTIIYTATDQAGNVGTATRTVNVVEPEVPGFTLTVDDSIATTTTDVGTTTPTAD